MSDLLTPATGAEPQAPAAPLPVVLSPAAIPSPEHKALDLAIIKKGAKDYLDFLDATKEVFYGYLYHRTGSSEVARTVLEEIYLDVLSRAMSLVWFGTLSLKVLIETADAALRSRDIAAADIETTYLGSLVWLTDTEKKSVATMHDALWSLPKEAQHLIILSLLTGLSDERIAQVMNRRKEQITQDLVTAKDLLLQRWQPAPDVVGKLNSLVFVPGMDIRAETKLRFSVVEKYNALRFRRYQWVIIGGLFAVMSNVIVASVLAFTVVTAPPTSLRATKSQVASLDAVLLKRQLAVQQAKGNIAASFKETQRLTAYSVSRDFTALGLASALESLKAQQDQESEVDRLLKAMQRARTALAPVLDPVVTLAWHDFTRVF